MRFVQKSLIVAFGAALGMTAVATAAAQKMGVMGSNDSTSARTSEENSTVVANRILDRWQPVAQQLGAGSPAWREMFLTQLSMMDAVTLKRIDGATVSATSDAKANYTQFEQAVRNGVMQLYVQAKSGKGNMKLASASNDQVFLPIPPCRVVDSRNSGGGGPIAAGTQRTYFIWNASSSYSWSSQGGVAGLANSVCPGTSITSAGGTLGSVTPTAAMATVTAVSPTAAGNFVVWGGNTAAPTSSAINFGAGQTLANTTVVPIGTRVLFSNDDFVVRYNGPSGQADVVVDVVGYFVENKATTLDCVDVYSGSNLIAAGATLTVDAPGCTTGYQMTGGECFADNGNVSLTTSWSPVSFSGGHWQCTWKNFDGSSHTVYDYTACCRVPGQ